MTTEGRDGASCLLCRYYSAKSMGAVLSASGSCDATSTRSTTAQDVPPPAHKKGRSALHRPRAHPRCRRRRRKWLRVAISRHAGRARRSKWRQRRRRRRCNTQSVRQRLRFAHGAQEFQGGERPQRPERRHARKLWFSALFARAAGHRRHSARREEPLARVADGAYARAAEIARRAATRRRDNDRRARRPRRPRQCCLPLGVTAARQDSRGWRMG